MILECPQCHSRYLVPDRAIGVDGRTVRCASCRHSWFQDGAPLEAAEPPVVAVAAPAPVGEVPPPSFLAPAAPEPVAADAVPFADSPDGEQAGEEPAPVRPRRNTARRWTAASIAAGVLMVVAVLLIVWSSAPGLLQQIGLGIGPAEFPLKLVDNPIERRDLSNGSELFAVSGKVLNPSGSRQRVPDIRADLRDASGRIVYSWTITPQQRTLGPKSAIDFNSAKLDVPATSKRLELSFAGEAGS